MFENWRPEEGWRVERRVSVEDCPTCGEPSEFYLCDVFGCSANMSIDWASGFNSNTAGRYVMICGKHAGRAVEEEKNGR
jgi:hypothetical protein